MQADGQCGTQRMRPLTRMFERRARPVMGADPLAHLAAAPKKRKGRKFRLGQRTALCS